MGFSSWFRDLGVPWKVSISVLGGVVVVSSAYGLYRCYVHQKEQPQDKTSLRDETASEISEKKVLVLGIEGSGKSTFLAALAQHDSPITSAEREGTTPTEGFHVVCVSTEGVSLNVWEIGGKFQSYWPNFVNDTSVIVYAIDSGDPALFDQSKHALLEILSDSKLKGVPLVLLICKQDLKEAKPVQEVVKFLGVETLSSDRQIGVAAFQILANGEVSGLQEAKHLILNFCK